MSTVLANMCRPFWPICVYRFGQYVSTVLANMCRPFWPICVDRFGRYVSTVLAKNLNILTNTCIFVCSKGYWPEANRYKQVYIYVAQKMRI